MNVGFIGLGSIGAPIAEHISSKFQLYFYARKNEVIKQFETSGIYCDSIAELSEMCDCIFIFVQNYIQCRDCIEKMSNLDDKIIVIGSTISSDDVLKLSNLVPSGSVVIDAPVSGGVVGAKNGTLTTMISGDPKAISLIRPIIDTYSSMVVDFGSKVGSAESMKSIVQLLVGINTVALSEAMGLANAMGLDLNVVYDVVTSSSASSKIFENRGKSLIRSDFSKRGNMATMRKDLNIVCDTSTSLGINLKLANACKELFFDNKENIDDELDFSAIYLEYPVRR